MNKGKSIIIVGGGVTGLTTAWRLARDGKPVELLEASPRIGGVIQTEPVEGFLAEMGPNTLQETRAETAELLADLGLTDKRLYAGRVSKNRYILRNGEPSPLPLSPVSLFFGNFFSVPTRLRLLAEPFIRRAPADSVETMDEFVRRRLGREILDYAINPFVAGTFAARPEDLAVRFAFPRLHQMEQQNGSLVKGAIFGKKHKPSGRRGIFSFPQGLRALPDALAGGIGDRIRTGVRVRAIESDGQSRWTVVAEKEGTTVRFERDGVVLAVPPRALRDIEINGKLAEERLFLRTRLPAPPLSVVFLGYRREQVQHPLDGFGMLVPEKEERKILGVLFSSSLFEGRAPEGFVSLTVFVGGSRQPELALKSEPEREELVRNELGDLLGAKGDPCLIRHAFWPEVIPHYSTGHGGLLEDLDALELAHPGLFIGGPVRQGVSIGDCIASGFNLAKRSQRPR